MKELYQAAHVRWFVKRDLLEVLDIEKRSFLNPWAEEDFLGPLKRANVVCLVAERRECVHGYVLYELCPNRLRLVRMAVHPSDRRQGIASALVDKLVGKLNGSRNRLTACVPESALACQLMLQANDFYCIKTKRQYFGDEDGYFFELST